MTENPASPARSITVSGTVDAPVERVFMLLSDPDRHPDVDGSGMVKGAENHLALTELGDVFTMRMENPTMGEYLVDNHVVVYDEDRAIGWAPANPGQRPAGHTWVWTLEPDGDDRTVLTLTYDWSAVTDPELLDIFPAVPAEQLQDSIRRVGEALA